LARAISRVLPGAALVAGHGDGRIAMFASHRGAVGAVRRTGWWAEGGKLLALICGGGGGRVVPAACADGGGRRQDRRVGGIMRALRQIPVNSRFGENNSRLSQNNSRLMRHDVQH